MTSQLGKTKAEMIEEADPSPETVSLRQQLADALADVRRLKVQVGDDEKLFDYVRRGIEALPAYERVRPSKPKGQHDPLEAVLILTDAHSEEFVSQEEMEGLASHDWHTHERRMQQVAEKTLEMTGIMRHASAVPHCTVYLLGDWFLGQIHPDELAGASMPLPRVLPLAGRTLADTMLRLAGHFEQVRVLGVVGNHGRTTRKPVYKMTADRNWDMSVYMIAQAFTERAQNLSWTLPKSIMHVDEVMGWKNLITHGNVANITHRTPYFGIEDSFQRQHSSRRGTDKDFDYAYLGHFHMSANLREEIMICPPMIGREQFGQYRLHLASPARQMLLFYSQKHGRTCAWPINLT